MCATASGRRSSTDTSLSRKAPSTHVWEPLKEFLELVYQKFFEHEELKRELEEDGHLGLRPCTGPPRVQCVLGDTYLDLVGDTRGRTCT